MLLLYLRLYNVFILRVYEGHANHTNSASEQTSHNTVQGTVRQNSVPITCLQFRSKTYDCSAKTHKSTICTEKKHNYRFTEVMCLCEIMQSVKFKVTEELFFYSLVHINRE